MAAGRTHYTLETTAYRDGYDKLKDVEGATFSKEENSEIWGDRPEALQPGWDVDDVWRRWRQGVRDDLDLRPSDDPGNFLCGFIYYASLSALWRRYRKGDRDGEGIDCEEGGPVNAGEDAMGAQVNSTGGTEESRKRGRKRVMFLHVPDSEKMGTVANGVEVAEGMIRALVESRRRGLCGDIVDASGIVDGRGSEKKERDLKKMW